MNAGLSEYKKKKNEKKVYMKDLLLQSNLYISIASGPGPTMLLERLCI